MSAGPSVRSMRFARFRSLYQKFEHCSPVDLPQYTISRRVYRRLPQRQLSICRPLADHLKTDKAHPETDGTVTDVDGDVALEQELLAIQDAAIAELEQKLGMPLQQAIQEDVLSSRNEALTQSHGEAKRITSDEALVEASFSPLAQLRQDGAPAADVAREARNIFGDVLPKDLLSEEELKVYVRHYGEPLPEVDEEQEIELEEEELGEPTHVLYDTQGEKVPYQLEDEREIQGRMQRREQNTHHITANEENEPEEVASLIGGELVDEQDPDDQDFEDGDEPVDGRAHPLTAIGKFATYPRTAFLPRETLLAPTEKILSDFSNRQLKEMCEKTFGGPGLPDSPLTPRSGRSRPQIAIPLDVSQNIMGQMEANAFLAAVMPPTYASLLATLTETRKRLGGSWLNKLLARPGGPRILDVGSGGVGIVAWREIVQAHWESLHASDKKKTNPPASKTVVLTASDTLRHRAAAMLENTTFIPRLPDYANTRGMPTLEDDRPAQQRKQFDVILASHSLFPLKEEWERKQHIQNLWSLLSDEGGVLIIIEKGIPRGFEALAGARHLLLERFIATPPGQETYYTRNVELDANQYDRQRQPGMIVAPCTNHERCPLYRTTGLSKGRKDICGFQQRYIRPGFLQRILGASDRNHDDVDFSYLSVMKGDDLRTRQFSTWEHASDPLSAPQHPDPTTNASHAQVVTASIKAGFEDSIATTSLSSLDYSDLNDDIHEFLSSTSSHNTKPLPTSQSPPLDNTLDPAVPPPPHLLPRLVLPPLKRRGHVTLDVCTPLATLERWTIPRSFSRQAYRDARKARWGDLWALGAKTVVPRNIKVGVSKAEFESSGGKEKGKHLGRRERKARQAERAQEMKERMLEEDEAEHEQLQSIIDEGELLDEDDNSDLIDMDTLLPRKASRAQMLVSSQSQPHSSQPRQRPSVSTPSSAPTQPHNTSNPRPSRAAIAKANDPAFANRKPRIGDDDPLASWSDDFRREIEADMKRGRAGSGKIGGAYSAGVQRASHGAKRDQKRIARANR